MIEFLKSFNDPAAKNTDTQSNLDNTFSLLKSQSHEKLKDAVLDENSSISKPQSIGDATTNESIETNTNEKVKNNSTLELVSDSSLLKPDNFDISTNKINTDKDVEVPEKLETDTDTLNSSEESSNIVCP